MYFTGERFWCGRRCWALQSRLVIHLTQYALGWSYPHTSPLLIIIQQGGSGNGELAASGSKAHINTKRSRRQGKHKRTRATLTCKAEDQQSQVTAVLRLFLCFLRSFRELVSHRLGCNNGYVNIIAFIVQAERENRSCYLLFSPLNILLAYHTGYIKFNFREPIKVLVY